MKTASWRDHMPAAFLVRANCSLERSREYRNETLQFCRETREACESIANGSTIARVGRSIELRQLQDIAADASRGSEWASIVCGIFDRIAKDADLRLRNWDRRRVS